MNFLSNDYSTNQAFFYQLFPYINEVDLKYTQQGSAFDGYSRSEHTDKYINTRFQPIIGDAIYKYYLKNLDELKSYAPSMFWELKSFEMNKEQVKNAIEEAARKIFKDKKFVEEFFVYSSFLVCVYLHCINHLQISDSTMIVESLEKVHEIFLVRRFSILGGWNALRNYVIRYFTY